MYNQEGQMTQDNLPLELRIIQRDIKKSKDILDRYQKNLITVRRDFLVAQKQVTILNEEIQLKKKALGSLVGALEQTRSSSQEYFDRQFSSHQAIINKEKSDIKEKEIELKAREKKIAELLLEFVLTEKNLKRVKDELTAERMALDMELAGFRKDQENLLIWERENIFRFKKAKEDYLKAESLLEHIKNNKKNFEKIKADHILTIKKEQEESVRKLKDIELKLTILQSREKAVSIKEEALNKDREYLNKRALLIQREAERIRSLSK